MGTCLVFKFCNLTFSDAFVYSYFVNFVYAVMIQILCDRNFDVTSHPCYLSRLLLLSVPAAYTA